MTRLNGLTRDPQHTNQIGTLIKPLKGRPSLGWTKLTEMIPKTKVPVTDRAPGILHLTTPKTINSIYWVLTSAKTRNKSSLGMVLTKGSTSPVLPTGSPSRVWLQKEGPSTTLFPTESNPTNTWPRATLKELQREVSLQDPSSLTAAIWWPVKRTSRMQNLPRRPKSGLGRS